MDQKAILSTRACVHVTLAEILQRILTMDCNGVFSGLLPKPDNAFTKEMVQILGA
jgi:hypothetical protein